MRCKVSPSGAEDILVVPAGWDANPLTFSGYWDVDVLDFVGLGLIEEDRDSTVVSGVNWVFEDLDVASPFCRAEVLLNTEDAVLA